MIPTVHRQIEAFGERYGWPEETCSSLWARLVDQTNEQRDVYSVTHVVPRDDGSDVEYTLDWSLETGFVTVRGE